MADIGTPALSGDVQGMASSNPVENLGEAPPKAPPMPKGRPSSPAAADREPASATPAPQPAGNVADDDADNPFADHTAPAAASQPQPAADADNPFVDQPTPVIPPSNVHPGKSEMASVLSANLAAHMATKPPPVPGVDPSLLEPENFLHDLLGAIGVGAQHSVAGYFFHGKPTAEIDPQHSDLAMAIGSGIGQFAGDLPAMAVGMVAGTAASPGVGNAVGAFALPAAIRKMYVDHYTRGNMADAANPAREFVSRLMGTAWETIKGGTVGAVTAGAGALARPVANSLGVAATELATMTTVGSALEGRLPDPKDFVAGAVLMGGMHSIGALNGLARTAPVDLPVNDPQTKLGNIHAATGETPAEIVQAADKDVTLKQDMVAGNAQEPPQAQPSKLVHETVKEPGAEGEPDKIVGTQTTLEPKTAAEVGAGGGEPPAPPELPGEVGDGEEPPPPTDLHSAIAETLSHIGESEDAPTTLGKIKDGYDQGGVWGGMKAFRDAFSDGFGHVYSAMVDKTDPIRRAMDDALKSGVDIDPEKNPHFLARTLPAFLDEVRQVLATGYRDADGKPTSEGLDQVLKAMPEGATREEYTAYVMSKRALELADRGLTPWGKFNRANAEMVVNSLADKYEEVDQRRLKFLDAGIDYAVRKGLLTEEAAANIREQNKQYSPSARVQEFDEFDDANPTGGGGTSFKRIKGDDGAILDPMVQTLRNTEALVRAARINEVRQNAVKILGEAKLIGTGAEGEETSELWLRKVEKDMLPTKVSGQEIFRALEKQGEVLSIRTYAKQVRATLPNATDEQILNSYQKEIDAGNAPQIDPKDAVFFRAQQAPLTENQFAVRVDGVRQVYEGDPDFVTSMKRLDGDPTSMGLVMRTAQKFANFTRFMVTGNPITGVPFALLGHIPRSQTMAWVFSRESNFLPFHSLAALGEYWGESSPRYQEFLRAGGAAGSFADIDESHLLQNGAFTSPKDAKTWGTVWNQITSLEGVKSAAHNLWNSAETMINFTDGLARFTEFKLARENGKGPVEAAMQARNVVPDYQLGGLQRSLMRTGIAFSGAHINSMADLFSQLKSSENGGNRSGVLTKLAVMGTMSAGLWYINKDDEAIQARPEWERNSNWLFNVTRFTDPNYDPARGDQAASIVKIPKPWAPGVLFGTGAEFAMSKFLDQNPQAGSHFARALTESVIPPMMPNIAQPVIEQMENRNGYTGRPLVPEYKQKLLPEMRYNPYTSETAKELAKLIGYVPGVKELGPSADPLASPAVVENYIRTWGGSLGSYALKVSDWAQRGFTPDSRGQDPIGDNPFSHRFMAHFPDFQDQRVADFYANKDEADTAMNSYKAATKAGDVDAAQAIAAAHPDYQVRLDGIAKGIAQVRKSYENVISNPDMSKEEKAQLSNALLFQMGSMAKEGNQMMNDFRKGTVQNNAKGN